MYDYNYSVELWPRSSQGAVHTTKFHCSSIASSRLNERAFFSEPDLLATTTEMEEVHNALPDDMLAALAEVRHRVARDELPLLSLLTAKPLLMQSSHLSFQEYFAARALCEDNSIFSLGVPPWRWSAWWANSIRLGLEMGGAFGRGLLRAGRVEGTSLDLSGQLAFGDGLADRPTVVRVITALMVGLTSLNLGSVPFDTEEASLLGRALEESEMMLTLTLRSFALPVKALKGVEPVDTLDFSSQGVGNAAATMIAMLIEGNATLTSVNLLGNDIGADAAKQLAGVLEKHRTLKTLCGFAAEQTEADLSSQGLKPVDAILVGAEISVHATLTSLNLLNNDMDADAVVRLVELFRTQKTVKTLCGFRSNQTEADLSMQGLKPVDAMLIAAELESNGAMTSLDLSGNPEIAALGTEALAASLKVNSTLTALNLSMCKIGAKGVGAIASALREGCARLKTLGLLLPWEPISGELAERFVSAAKDSASLEHLDGLPTSMPMPDLIAHVKQGGNALWIDLEAILKPGSVIAERCGLLASFSHADSIRVVQEARSASGSPSLGNLAGGATELPRRLFCMARSSSNNTLDCVPSAEEYSCYEAMHCMCEDDPAVQQARLSLQRRASEAQAKYEAGEALCSMPARVARDADGKILCHSMARTAEDEAEIMRARQHALQRSAAMQTQYEQADATDSDGIVRWAACTEL